ncbi:hypothetical protein C7E20_05005 [Sphingobium sp. AEW4]|nr:hypothetical protein C7E20_05005 [Sphingobium sp. AEW4]
MSTNPASEHGPIIVFDAMCVLCSANAAFVMRHDRAHAAGPGSQPNRNRAEQAWTRYSGRSKINFSVPVSDRPFLAPARKYHPGVLDFDLCG